MSLTDFFSDEVEQRVAKEPIVRPYSLPDYIEPDDNYVTCAICGAKKKSLSSHLRSHNITAKEYREKYNRPTSSENYRKLLSEKFSGENNPGFNHGGRLSPYSKNFKKYEDLTEEEVENKINNLYENNMKFMSENPERNSTRIEYYLAKGMTEEEAQQALKDRQTTFSLEICIEKYGEEEGRKRWLKRQHLWHKNYKKSNFSQVSQKLFWAIVEHLDSLDYIYFAQLSPNKTLDDSGTNNELRLKLDEKVVLPDFIDLKQNKIIEFDGIYWHKVRLEEGGSNTDEAKDELYKRNGYTVLRIGEEEFAKEKDKVIEKCLKFLKQ